MNPRVEYEMSEEDLQELLAACKPTPCMMIGGVSPASPQENANRAWARLGEKLGFDAMSVRPTPGKGMRFFTAIPNETAEQRSERQEREAEEHRQSEITRLSAEIRERQQKLAELQGKGAEEGK